MRFMITWKIPPASDTQAVTRFLEGGDSTPEGLKTLGRWHANGSTTCHGDLTL